MEVNLVCVGALKEKYFVDAVNEYSKRISGFCKINVIQTKDFAFDDIEKTKKQEATLLEKYKKGYCVAMEIGGQKFSSEGFAKFLKTTFDTKNACITFFIGGSNGLEKEFSDSCDQKISFSDLTFPHQLMRVILLEQIYRAFTIINNRSYHK